MTMCGRRTEIWKHGSQAGGSQLSRGSVSRASGRACAARSFNGFHGFRSQVMELNLSWCSLGCVHTGVRCGAAYRLPRLHAAQPAGVLTPEPRATQPLTTLTSPAQPEST